MADELAKVVDELQKQVAQLRADVDALKLAPPPAAGEAHKHGAHGLSMRISGKGAISVYGLGRFPTTLYKEQWLRLLAGVNDILAFIHENEAGLKTKQAKVEAEPEAAAAADPAAEAAKVEPKK